MKTTPVAKVSDKPNRTKQVRKAWLRANKGKSVSRVTTSGKGKTRTYSLVWHAKKHGGKK